VTVTRQSVPNSLYLYDGLDNTRTLIIINLRQSTVG